GWVIDLEYGQRRQCGVEEQGFNFELGADLFDAAPFDDALAVFLREGEAAADGDVGAGKEFSQFLPDLGGGAGGVGAGGPMVFARELGESEFGHTGMVADFFEVGCVMPPFGAQRVFTTCGVEGQRIEVVTFDTAVIWVGTESACQLIA